MISLKKLSDMVCTEAIEFIAEEKTQNHNNTRQALQPIRYNLELIQDKDNNLYWAE